MTTAADFMALAREEARRGIERGDGGPFGALVVRRKEVVARGHNEVLVRRDPTAHAEVLAIRRAARILGRPHLDDCRLFTTCEPCPMCLAAAAWARIPRIYFGCTRQDADAIGFSDLRIYALIRDEPGAAAVERLPLERPACLQLFEEWRGRDNAVLY